MIHVLSVIWAIAEFILLVKAPVIMVYTFSSSLYLYDGTAVRCGAEIGLLSPRLSASQGASLGDFLLAPECPIEKATL